MKKALVILMALSMAFAAFADEPAVTNAIAEFKGDATVTWGVDLDEGETGFKNEENASLKFNLIGTGDKATTGEGVWGEIKVKIADDPVQYKNGEWNGKTASVDFAKIHLLNNMLAIGIRSGDNKYGKYEPAVAVHNFNKDTKSSNGKGFQGKEVGGTVTDGITIEFTHDMLDLNIDFRSAPAAFAAADEPKLEDYDSNGDELISDTEYMTYFFDKWEYDALNERAKGAFKDNFYTSNYGIGTDVNVKVVPNLSLKAGFGMDFFGDKPMGIYAAAEYKADLGDFYLKPQAAFTMSKKDGADADLNLIGAVLFGWGDDEKQDPIKWVDDKVRNGFSVATNLNLSADDMAIPLCVGVWDSTFVENLKAGAELCVEDLGNFTDKYYVAFDCSYKVDVITPKFALKVATGDFYIYGAVDYTGIANTTLTLAYESGALNNSKAGKLNLSAKVSF